MNCTSPVSLALYSLSIGNVREECLIALSIPPQIPNISIVAYCAILLLTIVVEYPFYRWIWPPSPRPYREAWVATNLVNLATHPAVIFLFPWIVQKFDSTQLVTVLASESFAIIFEAYLLSRIFHVRRLRALTWSLVANILSWSAGSWLSTEIILRL